MGFRCGIVGLPNVGKSTLFNALTETAAAQAANYPFCTIEPNIGNVAVPDPRMAALAAIAGSAKIIETQLGFVDIAGLVRAGVLIVLKTTYDESIPSIYSPAFLLSQDQLMNLFGEAKIHRLEYYGRLMDWHTKWTENKRTLFHTTAYRFPLIKRLAHWRRNRQAEAGRMRHG